MIRVPQFLFSMLILVSAFSSVVSAQDALIGNWNVTAETPEGENDSVWTFKGSDGEISGSSVNSATGSVTEFDDLKVEGDEVSFGFDMEAQGTELRIDIDAKISDGKLEGDWVASDLDGNELAGGTLSGSKDTTEILFDGKSLDNFRGYKQEKIGEGWKIVDGILVFEGSGGDIITKKEYENFELNFEWMISEGGNSGVMYRVKLGDNAPYMTGVEYQILDNDKHADGKKRTTSAGALYALYAPGDEKPKAVGQWNTSKIVANGDKVEHWLNGVKVVEAEFGSDDWNKKVAASKFATWKKFAKSKKGHIAFQDHHDKVSYRNITIKSMN